SETATLANTVFSTGLGPWDFLLEKFPVQIVLAKKRSPSFNLMRLKPGWEMDYEDETSALFFRVASEDGKRVRDFIKSLPAGDLLKVLSRPILTGRSTPPELDVAPVKARP